MMQCWRPQISNARVATRRGAARLFALIVVAALMAGCAATHSSGPRSDSASSSRGAIGAIELYAMPVAMNWNDAPGPDGLQVRIMFYRLQRPLAIPVTTGRAVIDLYEGRVTAAEALEVEPFSTWTLTPANLQLLGQRTIAGVAYDLRLPWQHGPPRMGLLTILVRYEPPQGAATTSAPLVISMSGM